MPNTLHRHFSYSGFFIVSSYYSTVLWFNYVPTVLTKSACFWSLDLLLLINWIRICERRVLCRPVWVINYWASAAWPSLWPSPPMVCCRPHSLSLRQVCLMTPPKTRNSTAAALLLISWPGISAVEWKRKISINFTYILIAGSTIRFHCWKCRSVLKNNGRWELMRFV